MSFNTILTFDLARSEFEEKSGSNPSRDLGKTTGMQVKCNNNLTDFSWKL